MTPSALRDLRWGWDEALFHRLNGPTSSALDALARVASSPLFCFGVAGLAALYLLARRRAGGVDWLLASMTAGVATDLLGSYLLKPWFGRLRPCFALEASRVRALEQVGNGGSMPSLHAATAFAIATVLAFESPRLAPFYFALGALIGWSRIREGVHWPSDVAAGALLGLAIGGASAAVRTLWRRRRERR